MPTQSERDARLLLPRPALSGLIACLVVRDTRRRSLAPEARYNFYPATPLCGVTWVVEGEIRLVDDAGLIDPEPYPAVSFHGPQPRPGASWSAGPALAATVVFYPEAWRAIGGGAPADATGRHMRLDEAMDATLAAIFLGIDWAHGDAAAFSQLQDAMEPLWRDRRRARAAPWLGDWLLRLGTRSTLATPGTSARQVQRRIKAWTGQAQRDLAIHARVEALFVKVVREKGVGLADLAADMRYADQSHMGREVKRVTGHSPARILELMRSDERFWFYRLMGEHLRK